MGTSVLKSTGAIIAGIATGVILSVGTDMLLQNLGIFPGFDQPSLFTTGMLIAATLYRSAYNIAGGCVAAALAPRNPMRHSMILGAIGLLASIAGAVAMREKSAAAPWYPIALVVLALPCAWIGGRLFLSFRSLKPQTEP